MSYAQTTKCSDLLVIVFRLSGRGEKKTVVEEELMHDAMGASDKGEETCFIM